MKVELAPLDVVSRRPQHQPQVRGEVVQHLSHQAATPQKLSVPTSR